MERVLVIGSPGAGKSTFATKLARRTGLPLIHLDQQYWRSGWVEPPKEEWLDKLGGLIAGRRWIMDGNYAKAETDALADMLGALAAEAEWLAKGDDARFMNEVALRLQD